MKTIVRFATAKATIAALILTAGPAVADTDQSWVTKSFSSSPSSRPSSGGGGFTSLSGGWSGSGEQGVASYYWQPQRVAAGGWFNPNAMTAAHKSLPFGTRVRVTRLDTGRSVVVTINDRGPFVRGRIIDLSRRAAQEIGMTGQGIARVRVERI
ncbi:MAG: hypothetical protein RL291_312 [Pseudomonadota bacterium]